MLFLFYRDVKSHCSAPIQNSVFRVNDSVWDISNSMLFLAYYYLETLSITFLLFLSIFMSSEGGMSSELVSLSKGSVASVPAHPSEVGVASVPESISEGDMASQAFFSNLEYWKIFAEQC